MAASRQYGEGFAKLSTTAVRRLTSVAAVGLLVLTLLGALLAWRATTLAGSSWRTPRASTHAAVADIDLSSLLGLKW